MINNEQLYSEPPDDDTIIEQLIHGLQEAARELAPLFIRTMPRAYFTNTTQAMRLAHLKAIIAAEASGGSGQTLMLRDADGRHVTFISDRSYPGQLSEFVERLPRDLPLSSAQIYTSYSHDLVVDIFHFGEHQPCDPKLRARAAAIRQYIGEQSSSVVSGSIEHHLASCDAEYMDSTPMEQIYRHWLMAEHIRLCGNVLVQFGEYHKPQFGRITIGFSDYDPRLLFERVSQYLGRKAVDIQRAYLDSFKQVGEDITLLTLLINLNGDRSDDTGEFWQRIERDLRRLPHLDSTVFSLSDTITEGDLQAAELLVVLTHLAHQKLVKQAPLLFSRERIISTLQRYPRLASAVSFFFKEESPPKTPFR